MAENLVALALRFHPTGIYHSELGFADRPESKALEGARAAALADVEWWRDFCRDVAAAFPGHLVEDKSLLHLDRCWRIRVPLRPGIYEHAIVACVSYVAPLWLPIVSLPPSDALPPHLAWKLDLDPDEEAVAGSIERILSRHRAVRRVTPAEAREPVPNVAVDSINLDHATVADCLFTSDRG